MEITSWQIYWITRLESISLLFLILGIAGFMLGVFGLMFSHIEGSTNGQRFFPWIVIAGIVSGCFSAFIPSTKEMAAIIIVPRLVSAVNGNKQIMELPNNLVGLANDWINELKPKESRSRSGQ